MAMDWDTLGKKLSQLGQDTRSGMQKMSESVQLSSRLSEARRELQKQYAAIGETVVERFGENIPEGLENVFADVAEARRKVANLEKQIQQRKGVVVCPGCGRQAPVGEKYCSQCGTKLPEEEEPDETEANAGDAAEEDGQTAEETVETADDAVFEAETPADAGTETVAEEGEQVSGTDNVDSETDDASDTDGGTETAADEAAGKGSFDTSQLLEDAQKLGRDAGDLVNDAADKARVFLSNVADNAASFMKGVSSKLAEKAAEQDDDDVIDAEEIFHADEEEDFTDVTKDIVQAAEDAMESAAGKAEETAEENVDATDDAAAEEMTAEPTKEAAEGAADPTVSAE